ncbi:ATP phosphoribosyltransferase =_ HisGs [hydrothermal vent metagenome]|uniref:ATP phosphoribosyltransferase n=1 Tax=hydrothermal vent metagenome TaxID=652676 RepID=A0A3B0XVM8_9ZZZZ
MSNDLTIAVSKGRIFKDTLPLLEAAGIVPIDDPETSRKLILDTNQSDIKILVIRASDVPTYVEYGAAQVGVAGKDVLMEHQGKGLYEPVDLKIACCRLMVALQKGKNLDKPHLTVATKYVHSAKQYFTDIGKQVNIIKLYGSMELAPLVGLADCIVDLVDTGGTLKANGLVATEKIYDVSSRLVVNKAAMKLEHERIKDFVKQIDRAVSMREK